MPSWGCLVIDLIWRVDNRTMYWLNRYRQLCSGWTASTWWCAALHLSFVPHFPPHSNLQIQTYSLECPLHSTYIAVYLYTPSVISECEQDLLSLQRHSQLGGVISIERVDSAAAAFGSPWTEIVAAHLKHAIFHIHIHLSLYWFTPHSSTVSIFSFRFQRRIRIICIF